MSRSKSPIPAKERAAYADYVALRRERVMTMRNRLMTEREITTALGDPTGSMFMLNPKTKKPYTNGTIHKDLVTIRKKSIDTASKEYLEYRAMHLAEVREARKVAWSRGDLDRIYKFLKLEMELLGTLNGSVNINNIMINDAPAVDIEDLSEDELLRIASTAGDFDVIEGEVVRESSD